MKLEELQTGKLVAGVVPGKLVKVVAAEMRGPDALELVFRADGAVAQRRLSRADEESLVLASNQGWSPKFDRRLLAVLAVALVALAAFYLLRREPKAEAPVSNDIPIVIRTNGGMLEVATVKHRRTFNLTEVLYVAGIKVPFCKATAAYTVDTSITYRIKLAKEWGAFYRNQRLQLTAPPLEPALPVAFDTSRMKATLEKCPLMSSGTQDNLMRSIGGKLAQDAKDPRYVQVARNNGARDTVSEFAQKWLISQKSYNIPSNTPIDVVFEDE